MDEGLIFYAIGKITTFHDRDLDAVVTQYFDTHDEFGVVLPSAVRSGLNYATENDVKNWIVDVSKEISSMSKMDAAWEGSDEFRQLFRQSSVRNIVLIVSPPAKGESLDNARAWVEGFATDLGTGFRGDVASSASDTSKILLDWHDAD